MMYDLNLHLSADAIYMVSSYLFVNDMLKVISTNRLQGEKYKKLLTDLITNQLSKLNINPIEFCHALRISGAILSGSFVYQCLTGDMWSDSDIDIYTFDYGYHGNFDLSEYVNTLSPVENYLWEKVGKIQQLCVSKRCDGYIALFQSGVNNTRTYTVNGEKFQVININDSKKKFISKEHQNGIKSLIKQTELKHSSSHDRGSHQVRQAYHKELYELKLQLDTQIVEDNKDSNDDITFQLIDLNNNFNERESLHENKNSIEEYKRLQGKQCNNMILFHERSSQKQLVNLISETFDFDFLMNSFDGDNVTIMNPNSLLNKKSNNREIDKSNIISPLTHYRCLKYLNRGFEVPNYKFVLDDKKVDKIIILLQKLTSRYFIAKFQDDYHAKMLLIKSKLIPIEYQYEGKVVKDFVPDSNSFYE